MEYFILSKSPLFKGLSADEIKSVLSVVHYRIKKFKTGTLISQSGEPVSSLMIVIQGFVKGEMTDYAGRLIKIEDIPAPGALAPAFMFGNNNRFPVDIVAGSEVGILLIEKGEFVKILIRNSIILINFLDMISNRSQFLSDKIKFLNFKTIKGKLAYFLLQKAGKDRSLIHLDMTQAGLAEYFGVARPSVARALGEMEKEGYLEAKGKTIKIIDKERLALLESE
jgi:CRP/FNR family transcriptional regulator, dissimilatory nitrate respiration regulator